MADMLKFKHGLQANMKENSPPFSAGTVYVTRDERAIYVDLPFYSEDEPAKRIRIGDMRTYEYLDDLKNDLKDDLTTLSTTALYYAEKNNSTENKTINALLKWNGKDFIRLNEVSDITANLTELEGIVSNLQDNFDGLSTSVNDLTSIVENNTTDIEQLNTIIGPENTSGLVKDVKDLQGITNGHTEDIQDLNDNLAITNQNVQKAQDTADGLATSINNIESISQSAKETADNALARTGGTMTGSITMSNNSTINGLLSPTNDDDAVNKKYVDDIKKSFDDIIGIGDNSEDTLLEKIQSVDDKASAATTSANNAQETADNALPKAGGTMFGAIDMGEQKVINLKAPEVNGDAANKKYVDDIKNSLISLVGTGGITEDLADHNTIKGTKKYIDEKIIGVNTSIDNIQTALVDLTTVMNFIGKSTTNPITDVVTINGKIITPNLGDVVVYNAFEYVYTGEESGWEIFGNVTADESRFQGIEQSIDDIEKSLNGIPGDEDTEKVPGLIEKFNALKDTVDGHDTSINNNTSNIDNINGDLTTIKSRLTNTENVANAAATQINLSAEITRATEKEAALEKEISDNLAAQTTTNNNFQDQLESIIDPEIGYLAWGTF